MKSQIVEYLRLKAATIGGVNTHLGIHELRTNGNGQSVPYAYVGGDNLQPLDIDSGSVGYFRTYQREEFTPVDGMRAERDLSGTFYIRYAAILHRDTRDHAAYAEDVANAFTGYNSDLKSILKAKRVNITRSSIETDISRAWREEFSVPVTDLPYNLAMVFVDVTVTVVGSRDCWQGCSETYDILQGFDWCNPATVARLTEEQRECVRGFLPTPCEDADWTLDNTDGTELSTGSIPSGGSAVIVAPDGNIELNGTPVGVVASGGTTDIPVIQDGLPAGSWNGTQWVIPSCPAGGVSLAVTVSDNNPNAGDTLTITATPSAGFSPNNYLFFATQSGVITYIGEQAGNVINWDVSLIGAFTVFVQSDDGTIGTFNVGGEPVTATGLLLDVFNAAVAYSVRRLRVTASLCMRVRRASDNTEQDIGFINNAVNAAAIASFCGASDGFVVTWYDQSSNGNHASESSLSAQPKIYDGATASVLTVNGRASLEFNGTSHKLQQALGVASTAGQANFGVFNRVSGVQSIVQSGGSTVSALQVRGQNAFFRNSAAIGVQFAADPVGQVLMENVYASNVLNTYINGAQTIQVYVFTSAQSYTTIGRQSSLWHNGGLQEVIHFAQDMTADRDTINANINTYFNVY